MIVGTTREISYSEKRISHRSLTDLRSITSTSTRVSTVQYPFDPSWAAEQALLEADLFAAVNSDRMENGQKPLVRDSVADAIARWKAEQMCWAEYMDHIDHIPPDEIGNHTGAQVDRQFGARFVDYGYDYHYGIGENIAYGFLDSQSCENAFMSDVGHRDNVLSSSWAVIGIGVAKTTDNCAAGLKPMPGLNFFVQDFASGSVSPQPTPTPTKPAIGSKWHKPKSRITLQVDSVRLHLGVDRVYMHRIADGAKTSAPLSTFYTTYVPA